MIIGNGGSGKSTLARTLHQQLGLPVIHLDQYYWQSNWQAAHPKQWREIHQGLIMSEQWIMEGTQYRELQARIERAEKIIFIDKNPLVCAWRLLKKHRLRKTENDGYIYQFKWRNLWWVLRFNWRYRQKILALLKITKCQVEILR